MYARLIEVDNHRGGYRALQIGNELYRREGRSIGRWEVYGGITPEDEVKIEFEGRSLDAAIPVARERPEPQAGDWIYVRPIDSPKARKLRLQSHITVKLSGIVSQVRSVLIRRDPSNKDITRLLS